MATWPAGLRPRALRASASGIEFIYRGTDKRCYRVNVMVSRSGRLSVHAIPSGEPEVLGRLIRALAVRLGQQPDARRWVAEASSRARALARWKSFSGSGDALPPAQQACDELVQLVEAAIEQGKLDAAALAEHMARIRELTGRSQEVSEALDELCLVLWLALGEFGRALRWWDEIRARIEASSKPPARACEALMAGFSGRAPEVRAALTRLVEDSRDSHDLRVAGELYHPLPGEAVDALARAADEQDDFPSWRRVAVCAAEADQRDRIRDAARRLVDRARDPAELLEAARLLREGGAFIEAERVYQRLREDSPDAVRDIATLELARSSLWRLELDRAIALAGELLQREHDGPERASVAGQAARILGAAELLAGRPRAAIEHLDRAIAADPRDDEALLWRARAHDRCADYLAAEADLARTDMGDRTAWQLMFALVREHLQSSCRNDREWYFVASNLSQLLGDAGEDDVASTAERIEQALARLGGNLGARLTTTSDGSDPLRWLDEVESPRARAERVQRRLIHCGVETVLADFDRCAREFPQVPTFITYAAEIRLWLGDYADASESFERVWEATRTRWGYVGGGAAALMLGRFDRALELWAEGESHYTYMEAEATYAYRGELYLRRGDFELARRDLEHAVGASPGRLGAWIALGLLHARTGDEAGLRRCFAQVEARAPVLMHMIRRATPGEPEGDTPTVLATLLEAALERLRGNRSTVLYTFCDDDRLHVLPAGMLSTWQELAERLLQYFADELIAATVGGTTN
ncbi:MAG TPA: hypothetical protein VK034_01885 [Enhygromyxa sp.]|nr:hypothetical protein [Enhygromyxa sp.]